jgi:ABC-type nickel/cobalt efflux system permease component RcnA
MSLGARAIAPALLVALAAPAVVQAHPLGNFTINHYAGVVVAADEVRLDVVIDLAEIPTFQERRRLDADADGEVSDLELGAAREPECRALAPLLELAVDRQAVPLRLAAAGLTLPPGAGGLPTMRLVCGFVAPLPGGIGAGRTVAFADRSHPGQLGWREIVVAGDGVTVTGPGLLDASISRRLTDYPADRLASPLAMDAVEFRAQPGGPALEPFVAPDAGPVDGEAGTGRADVRAPAAAAPVPGGIGTDLPAVFQARDLSPAVVLAALGAALALGAGHALTPGHGKALIAAYLVGRRGSARHAAALGLSVSASHTLGILALAALIAGAGASLPADVVVRWMPVVAALAITGVGAWMLAGELRRRRAGERRLATQEHEHAHGHRHGHPGGGPDDRGAGDDQAMPATTVTWRSLFALGLAGGMVPSTSALVILLGAIAAGRPAFGIVLVLAFGLGMAGVMAGLGFALVLGRDRVARLAAHGRLGTVAPWAPLAAAVLVLALGVWLTAQAAAGARSL